MVGLAKLSSAMLGMSTITNGLAVSQSVVPGMSVLVQPGEIYSPQNLEATAYSSLAADTAHTILKQGIALNTTTLAIAAPTTAGYSISYLVQAAYQDSDTGSTVLPYYNASNPAVAYSGPANAGTTQPTTRAGIVSLNAKAGIAATTGSQTAPSPDTGYVGMYVVAVANGAASVVNANISLYVGASGLPSGGVIASVQANALVNAADTGAANAYVCAYSPAITTLTDGLVVWFKALNANSGAATLKVNALTAVSLVGGAHAALQGGEIVASGKCMCVYNASLAAFVLLECTGAALQVGAATKSGHAVQLSQLPAALGYTPVQQGTGIGQTANTVKIGWSGSRLKATVDTVDQGNIVFDSQSPAVLAASGYQKLPSGLIIQWSLGAASGTSTTGTFPIAFPNACFAIAASDTGSGTHTIGISGTTTGYTMWGSIATTNFQWIAIGY